MKIVLCCAGGMSTSLLMNKMLSYAKENNIDVDIEAVPISKSRESLDYADILLLGPQVKFEYDTLKDIAEEKGVKLAVINMQDYGMMKGEKVLIDALKL